MTAVEGRCVNRINCAGIAVPVTRTVEVDGAAVQGVCTLATLDEMYTLSNGFNSCVLDSVSGMHHCAQNNFNGDLLPEWLGEADKLACFAELEENVEPGSWSDPFSGICREEVRMRMRMRMCEVYHCHVILTNSLTLSQGHKSFSSSERRGVWRSSRTTRL